MFSCSTTARRTMLLRQARALSTARPPPLPEVVTTIAECRRRRAQFRGSVGFVPTMGSLHAGHLSLATQARAENAHVVVSVFVNPTQFAAHEDLDNYPRSLAADLELLRGTADLVFAPADAAELYPAGATTVVDLGPAFGGGGGGEAGARPHFFKGVATICAKLFNVVRPRHCNCPTTPLCYISTVCLLLARVSITPTGLGLFYFSFMCGMITGAAGQGLFWCQGRAASGGAPHVGARLVRANRPRRGGQRSHVHREKKRRRKEPTHSNKGA